MKTVLFFLCNASALALLAWCTTVYVHRHDWTAEYWKPVAQLFDYKD